MDKKKSWKDHLPSRRRLIQLYAALLYNANLKGFGEGQINTDNGKNFCVPGLNCYSCPGAIGACPLGSLQNALASSKHRGPYYVIGFLMLLGLLFGRLICGFLCPFGLIQELLHKIPTPKLKKNRFTHILSYLKYVILVVFVILIPLMYAAQSYPVPAFCKYICPAGTLEGAIGLLSNAVNADKFSMLNILFTRKVIILILVLTLCVFCYRPFCRFICPLGAIYGFFCRVALLGVKVDPDLCTNCGLCVRACKMDVQRVGDHECIQCGECRKVCPAGAIKWKCPGKKASISVVKSTEGETCKAFSQSQNRNQKENENQNQKQNQSQNQGQNQTANDTDLKKSHRREAIIWIVALLFLAGVLWYYNHPESTEAGKVVETETEIETESKNTTEVDTVLESDKEEPENDTEFESGQAREESETAVENGSGQDETDEITERETDDPDAIDDSAGSNTKNGSKTASDRTLTRTDTVSGTAKQADSSSDEAEPVSGTDASADTTGTDTEHESDQADASEEEAESGNGNDRSDTVAAETSVSLEDLETGEEVGMLCPDFTVPLYGGSEFHLEEELESGKIIVINFWATWCTPCCAELPYFQQISEDYADEVTVIAIHSSLITDDVEAYLEEMGYEMNFALDETGDVIASLGGSTMLPMTVILDQDGVIVYNQVGSVTYEFLAAQIKALL